jgi:hypothetical protein
MAWLSLSVIGSLIGFAAIKPLQNRFDKKHILIASWCLMVGMDPLLVSLRFLDILPQNGDSRLLVILVIQTIVGMAIGILAGTTLKSLGMKDVAERLQNAGF